MDLIKTKDFDLATHTRGNSSSPYLALVLPGRLDTKDYPHMLSHVEYLAKRGYFALSFDPPGTWESPGSIQLYTMTNYLKAINELIEYFGNKPTFIMGHSRGGSMAMLAGIGNPYITSFASVMSTYSYKPEVHGGYPDEQWEKDGYKIHKRDIPGKTNEFVEFRLPYTFLEDQIQYDMLAGLKESKKPKLFILGQHDKTVLPGIVKTAYDAASDPKVLGMINSDHSYGVNNSLIKEVNDIIGGGFLDEYDK
ncbi:MAG: hypothetical protein UT37_C0022G0007 [Parcubacteria group bacterium GW2011_GWA2_39_18]|nr:MAG: hypothetical protein UT37_C0022G0007 [Parcubacteria group bacterium GW2011_GWA2_39_18]